jgi:hypothetical protein
MIVDRAWVERNLGFYPIATPAPSSAFAFEQASWGSGRLDGPLSSTAGAASISSSAWGGVPYWNAFIATLEMHAKGT